MRPSSLVPFLGFVLAACQCQQPAGGPRCQTNVDCPSSLVCNTVDDLCVQCLVDDACPSGTCLDGICADCGPMKACPQGQLCSADGSCKAGCETHSAGCTMGQFCLPGSTMCVECVTDADCGAGRVCDQSHICRAGCSQLNPVCLPGQICDVMSGTCVGCLSNTDCHAPLPVCDPSTRSCVGCVGNTDCQATPATPICDTPNHTCVQCNLDTECGPGQICRNQACVPGCSQLNPVCLPGKVCDVPNGRCVQCLSDNNCSGATPRCDTVAKTCVACLPGPTDNCPMGQYCRNDHVCERGCKTNADCPSGVCLPDHSCQGCTMDNQCAAGKVCQAGVCTAACSATNPCGAGKTCCQMHCVDFLTDRTNCGGCGTTCGAQEECCGAAGCVRLDTTAHCGSCTTTCAASEGCCGGSCQSLTTPQRCGGCYVTCGPNQFCDSTQMCRNIIFPEFCANRRVYAIYDGIGLDNGATDVLASTVIANCPVGTTVTYGPQTNAQWVDQTTGELLLGAGSTVVTAGGPIANKPVKWLEKTSMTTKVFFESNGIDTFFFKRRSDNVAVASLLVSTCSSHHDMLVVELASNPSNGTLALIVYGVCAGGYGTAAAGWHWANVMLPNRMSYPDSWYVLEWNDTNMDSLPNVGDSFVTLASGM